MIAHLRGREEALEPFGWSQEDTEWVAMVCLHSGMFTRTQYMAYFNTYHLRAARFVQNLVNLKLAVEEEIPVISTRNRTRACRITRKSIYRELGIPNVRHRKIADPAVYLRRLLSLDYVIEHPELEWLPTEEEKVFYCTGVGVPKNQLPKRIYGGSAGSLARYFHLKLPIAGGPTTTFVYVDPGNNTSTELRNLGWAHQHVWRVMRERGIKIHVAAIGINPDADNRARAVLAGWARDNTGANGGSNGRSPHAAELQKEIDALSRALDTFDSKVLARFGGFTRAGARYRSLRGMLANPTSAAIRIDTFEVWRSWRIYPSGVQLYEAPE